MEIYIERKIDKGFPEKRNPVKFGDEKKNREEDSFIAMLSLLFFRFSVSV